MMANKSYIKLMEGSFMKKISLLSLFILMLLYTTAYAKVNPPSNVNNYEISVELNISSKMLTGQEKITYYNNEGVSLNEIYFHLYPNAFKSRNTIPYYQDDFNNAFPEGFKPGCIDITGISCKSRKIIHEIQGKDSTILRLKLDKPLNINEKLELVINFKIVIPPSADRFGYYNNCYNFGNWYPVAAVYDESGWNLDPYYAVGDPFYSDVSNYTVKITVPQGYVVASSGDMTNLKYINKKKVYTFRAGSMRDFAWSASNKYIMHKKSVGGITLKSYYLKGHESKNSIAESAAEKSLNIYNSLYGKYPYKTYSIVDTNIIGGMEYPGIVFISRDLYNEDSSQRDLEAVVAHETAHQWWYGVVGDDEIDDAWLDESFATYSEALYYEKRYGTAAGTKYYQSSIVDSFNNMKNDVQGKEVIQKPLDEFKNWDDYVPMVYYKGAMMLDSIRKSVGDNTFFTILKSYYTKYQFKNARTIDFINTVKDVTKKDWSSFFDKWLYEK